MAKAQAWQHIYASVELEQSPRGRAGFQTLFYSRSGLTQAEVEEMEARLVYFPSGLQAVKHLFSPISTGKIMVAQIVQLPEPDRLGREGRYLAHNLVFEPDAFRQIECDPFPVLRQFPFITTITQALEAGDRQTGDIPPAALQVRLEPALRMEVVGAWPTQSLKELALLALRAGRLRSERVMVALSGEPRQVEEALEATFLALPTAIRQDCSFDTYAHHCNLVDTYYWALGLLDSPGNRRFINVDARSRHVDETVAGQPETAYERWVTALVESRQLEAINHHREHAYATCAWLEGRAHDTLLVQSAPPEVVDLVFELNREAVHALIRRKLAEVLPAPLARRAFWHVGPRTPMASLFGQLRTRFRFPDLAEALYRAYESQAFRAPPREEIRAIDWLLQRVDHPFLRLLHTCWTNRRDDLYHELQLLDRDQYARFVQVALRSGIVEPQALLVPGKGGAFLDVHLAPGGPAGRELASLVQALLGVGEAACLSRLAALVRAQPERELHALARIIARRPEVPGPFRLAVGDTIASLPRGEKSLLARLLDR